MLFLGMFLGLLVGLYFLWVAKLPDYTASTHALLQEGREEHTPATRGGPDFFEYVDEDTGEIIHVEPGDEMYELIITGLGVRK